MGPLHDTQYNGVRARSRPWGLHNQDSVSEVVTCSFCISIIALSSQYPIDPTSQDRGLSCSEISVQCAVFTFLKLSFEKAANDQYAEYRSHERP